MSYSQEQLEDIYHRWCTTCVPLFPGEKCKKCNEWMHICFKKHFFEEMTPEKYVEYEQEIRDAEFMDTLSEKRERMRRLPKDACGYLVQIKDGKEEKHSALLDLADGNIDCYEQTTDGLLRVRATEKRMKKLQDKKPDWLISYRKDKNN